MSKDNNPFFQKEVIFEPIEHKYTEIKSGKILISVSQLLHLYQKPFDPENHILRACAKRENIKPEELKKRWDFKRDQSCIYGSAVHAEIEYFINTKKIRKSDHKDIVTDFKKNVFPEFKHSIYSEVLVYSLDLLIAGLSDLVEYNPETNEISISDIKTNESLAKKSYNNLLYPLNYLKDNHISRYSLQLSFYAYLLQLRGFKVKENFKIFWVNPENRRIEIIPIKYMKREVELILDHYVNGIF